MFIYSYLRNPQLKIEAICYLHIQSVVYWMCNVEINIRYQQIFQISTLRKLRITVRFSILKLVIGTLCIHRCSYIPQVCTGPQSRPRPRVSRWQLAAARGSACDLPYLLSAQGCLLVLSPRALSYASVGYTCAGKCWLFEATVCL